MIDLAAATYHRPAGPERAQELARLRGSRSPLDRLAARLVERWDAADREERRRP